MPRLTLADAGNKPMKRGWVDMTDREEAQNEAQSAREAAAKALGRKRKSPLYDNKSQDED